MRHVGIVIHTGNGTRDQRGRREKGPIKIRSFEIQIVLESTREEWSGEH